MQLRNIQFILKWSHDLISFLDNEDNQYYIKDVEEFQDDLMKIVDFSQDELNAINIPGWSGINKELDMELILNQALDLKPTLFSKYVECVNQ